MNKEELKTLNSLVEIQIPENCIENKLSLSIKENRKLRIKLGFDPTAPDLHLGHSVVLKKLKQFQDFGHEIIVIIGDFTARIGDPTGKNKARPSLSKENVIENSITYINQLSKVLDISKVSVEYNSKWLQNMNLSNVIKLMSTSTVAQMLQRTDFNNRFNNGTPISLHELIYPLLQGKDSLEIKSDIEIGGTDQLFNCLLGRHLQETNKNVGQGVVCMPLLRGTDGSKKMSKSENNYIGLTDVSTEMYGKIMSIPDDLLEEYITLVSHFKEEEKENILSRLRNLENPMKIKKELAFNIVEYFYSKSVAKKSELLFYNQVQKKDLSNINYKLISLGIEFVNSSIDIITLCNLCNPEFSRSHLKRLILGGGVQWNGEKVINPNLIIPSVSKEDILKIGKRAYYKFT